MRKRKEERKLTPNKENLVKMKKEKRKKLATMDGSYLSATYKTCARRKKKKKKKKQQPPATQSTNPEEKKTP